MRSFYDAFKNQIDARCAGVFHLNLLGIAFACLGLEFQHKLPSHSGEPVELFISALSSSAENNNLGFMFSAFLRSSMYKPRIFGANFVPISKRSPRESRVGVLSFGRTRLCDQS